MYYYNAESVRLACVRRSASVHPEPGSNSSKKYTSVLNLFLVLLKIKSLYELSSIQMVALIYFPNHNMISIIDWIVLNYCIRNGNRCFHSPHQHHRLYKPESKQARIIYKISYKIQAIPYKDQSNINNDIIYYIFSKEKLIRPISTSLLNMLPYFHMTPINPLVSRRSYSHKGREI